MGLFGGFKAKFTRNSATKVKPQEVVCLKYHVHAEFDRQDPPITIPVQNNIKKNEVVRSNSKLKVRKALAKSAVFQDSDTSNTSLSSPPAPFKSTSLTNLNGEASKPIKSFDNKLSDSSDSITITTTIEVPSNSKSVAVADTNFDRSIGEYNGVVTENVKVATNNRLYSTNNIKTEKYELSSFKPNEGKEINGHSEQSTLIFMTQHSADPYEKNAKNVENGEDNFEINFSAPSNKTFKANRIQENADSDQDQPDANLKINFVPNKAFDEDDFKVNHVQHDVRRSDSYSDDEKSYEDEDRIEFTKMGFSSQAASIFFGQDIEPDAPRPRRVILKNNDVKDDDDYDDESSDADC